MKAVLQRVTSASVTVDGQVIGKIGHGLMILLGVAQGDTENEAELLAEKAANLRIFCDENDKMNRSVLDENGEALVISNFTLCADASHGRRPSYFDAMEPAGAQALYQAFGKYLQQAGVRSVAYGQFGADMKVELTNNGPVTIILDTEVWNHVKG